MNKRLFIFLLCGALAAAACAQGFEWALSVGGGGWESGRAMALDKSGNAYLTGDFEQSVMFGGGADAVTLTSAGARDIFFAKYTPEGQVLWARQIGGPNLDFCAGVGVGPDETVFLAGYFEGSVDFDPGPGEFFLNSAGDVDVFVAKYTPQGELIWAFRIGNEDVNVASGLALGPDGDLYICGYFYGAMDFDPNPQTQALRASNGSSDIFIAKYEQSSGALMWAKSMGGVNIEEAVAVQVDRGGSVLLGGNYIGAFDFDPGAGELVLPTYGQQDIFFAKFSPDGNLLWARGIGSPFGNDGLRGIASDADDNVLICGFYRDEMDVNPLIGALNLPYVALTEAFVAKYTPSGLLLWAKGLSSIGANEAWTVHADEANNVHVGGFFSASVNFNPGGSSAVLNSAGKQDGFVARYSPQGAYVWSGALSGPDDIMAFGSLWSGGSLYLTGRFRGNADFDPGVENFNLSASGNFDLFLARYAACPGLEAVALADSVSCFNGSDGGASVSAFGGSPPYQYVWNPGQQSGPQLSGVSAGDYTALVTDAANCVLTRRVQVGQPAPL
ncbi:MAG: SprB repeat-containing protein, partial [Saprospiraceae bacterium]